MIQKIKHANKEIIYIDYRGMDNNQMIITLNEMKDTVLRENQFNLRLINVTDTSVSAQFRTRMRQIGKEIGHIPSKVGVVGVPLTLRVVINSYNRLIGGKMKLFTNEEDALDYLVS